MLVQYKAVNEDVKKLVGESSNTNTKTFGNRMAAQKTINSFVNMLVKVCVLVGMIKSTSTRSSSAPASKCVKSMSKADWERLGVSLGLGEDTEENKRRLTEIATEIFTKYKPKTSNPDGGEVGEFEVHDALSAYFNDAGFGNSFEENLANHAIRMNMVRSLSDSSQSAKASIAKKNYKFFITKKEIDETRANENPDPNAALKYSMYLVLSGASDEYEKRKLNSPASTAKAAAEAKHPPILVSESDTGFTFQFSSSEIAVISRLCALNVKGEDRTKYTNYRTCAQAIFQLVKPVKNDEEVNPKLAKYEGTVSGSGYNDTRLFADSAMTIVYEMMLDPKKLTKTASR
jgi:hypothetical protein